MKFFGCFFYGLVAIEQYVSLFINRCRDLLPLVTPESLENTSPGSDYEGELLYVLGQREPLSI
jgi:hypothetical protein